MEISIDSEIFSLPDFLIVGGARCGTSSLYSYLKEHPEIFLPDFKEPHFFNYLDCNESPHPNGAPWTIADYLALFKDASPEHKLGEASTSYLYFSNKVIRTLRAIYGDKASAIRIIIVLRNPIDRAWSYHMLLRRSGYKMNFFEMTEKYCGRKEKTFHDFISAGHYEDNVRDYLTAFDSVRIFMFDDLKDNPVAVVRSVFEFIDVNDTEFLPSNINTVYNTSGVAKSGSSRFVYNLMFHDFVFKKLFKHILPLHWRLWLKAEVGARITKNVEMPSDVREFLTQTYRESTESLFELLPDPSQKAIVANWLK